jgi:hypothetical protein
VVVPDRETLALDARAIAAVEGVSARAAGLVGRETSQSEVVDHDVIETGHRNAPPARVLLHGGGGGAQCSMSDLMGTRRTERTRGEIRPGKSLSCLALVVAIGVSGAHRAKAADGDDAAAEARLKAGTQAFRAGLYDAALDEFATAFAIRRSPRLEFNLAETLLALKRDAEAGDAFEAFLADGANEPADFRNEARRQIALASTRTAAVLLPCGTAAHDVVVDGHPRSLPRPPDRVRVAPGSHRIEVTHVSPTPLLDERVDLLRGERVTLSLCVPAPLAPAVAATSLASPPVGDAGRTWWTGRRVALAVGIAAVIAGATVLAVAASRSGPPGSSLGNYPL